MNNMLVKHHVFCFD